MLEGAIFDIDGTLVDSVDAHAEAWSKAFAARGYQVRAADVRPEIGKGGDTLLPVFLDEDAIARDGAALEQAHNSIFRDEWIGRVRPFPAVRALFEALRARGVRVALASSSEPEDLARYKAMLEVEDLLAAEASSGDAQATKPAPDVFQVALDRLIPLDRERALAFGDSPWDAQAAARLHLRTVGMRCGGFSDASLEEAGAIRLYDDPAALLAGLDEVMALV